MIKSWLFMDNTHYLFKGIEASILTKSLTPLIKALQISLQYSPPKSKFDSTIFSSDSFCAPHLDTQLFFFRSLQGISDHNSLGFINYPIGSAVVANPDLNLLRRCHSPSGLLRANSSLIADQSQLLNESGIRSTDILNNDISRKFSIQFDNLIASVSCLEWASLDIDGFNFHDIAIRDLSLCYKAGPDLATKQNDPFFEHFLSIKYNNLFLLCLLLLNSDHIGGQCFFMSMYSSELVFQYFCERTSRKYRHFFPPPAYPRLEEFGLDSSTHILLNHCPNSIIQLTDPSVLSQLRGASLSEHAYNAIQNSINDKFLGTHSHTYSKSVQTVNPETAELNNFISLSRAQGKKIVSVFTSSMDETIGFEKSLKLFPIDMSHLGQSIFNDQEDWLRVLINHFSQKEDDSVLIIRLHPRMGDDKRGHYKSPYHDQIIDTLLSSIGDSGSIKLILPSEPISSYSVGMSSDLVLNGWSTIGLEFAIKDCNVNNAFRFCNKGGAAYFPVHIGSQEPATKAQYLQNIDTFLSCSNASSVNSQLIGQIEASKAFIAIHAAGLINTSIESEFRSQLSDPVLLTPSLLSLITS